MRPFTLAEATRPGAHLPAGAAFIAGGTTLLDLMKLDILRPEELVDVTPLATAFGTIRADVQGLQLGALLRMAEVAADPTVRREYPVIAESLALAASPQLRNMATLGGNVLQRTRCSYFRDIGTTACNKRSPGSGCAALAGYNRLHAVLGTSAACIASYPGDFAQALIALDATVALTGPDGARQLAFADLHRLPGDRPDQETTLRHGELITGFSVPAGPWARRSLYLKVRDRESYAFAAASAAVALHLEDGVVRVARIALGGVATVPWRAPAAEAALLGHPLDAARAEAAARAAFADSSTHGDNDFKPELGRRTLVRALLQAATMEA